MVDDDSSLNKEESLKRFAIRYYGMECTEYGEGFSLLAEMTQENESTKRNIRERIMNESNIIKFFVNAMGQSIEQEAENIIMKIDSELYGIDAKNIPEYHLLDNRSLIKYAVNEIKKIL
jgi:predicted RNA-binding protein with PUA domain